ncbi:MAG: DNA repair protein RecN [Ruminococcaceae bacterium]|nr:DNA repair protein RecN [Oscillospiraceae bacterium]
MLTSLFVSDLALIRRLSVDFHRGFSVLTGETGAGKSLVLDSLGLFLSPKAGKELVRHGEEKLEVSLFFTELTEEQIADLAEFVSSEEAREGVTLTRIVYASGKNLSKLCGRTLPFSRLSALAAQLLAIHGQNSAVGLLDEKNHRRYLDDALSPEGQKALAEYKAAYTRHLDAKKALDKLRADVAEGKEKLALYEYQMQEIARVKPKKGEEDKLEEKLCHLQNFEKEYGAVATAHRALSGGEKGKGAVFLLSAAARKLEELGEGAHADTAARLYELAESAKELESDLSAALSDYGEEDPGDLMDRIRKRLDTLYRLKQKFGMTVDELLDYYEQIKEKKDLTLRGKDDIKKGELALKKLSEDLVLAAENLTRARRETAERLESEIHGTLAFLDMPKMRFSVLLTPEQTPGADGAEKVAFGIAANVGEGTKPLAQVASGGEMSRIMLALSLKLLKEKDAPTMVFDEIDTGISGATAQKIGICLRALARERQIFCVTHSAQVATLADHHLLVAKSESEGRTETTLTLLDAEGSQRETARLLGGRELSDEARLAADKLRSEGLAEYEKLKDRLT